MPPKGTVSYRRLSMAVVGRYWLSLRAIIKGELVDARKVRDVTESETGGRCEIRTHGAVAGTPVFKTGALDHSANLPVSRRFWSRHNVGFVELVSPEEARFARVLSRPVH